MSLPASTWSPDEGNIVTQCVAAMPVENARARLPPSSAARVVSNARRVGLPLRE
jgi:hypothetical protein